MKKEVIRLIVRKEKFEDQENLIAFYPDCEANFGNLMSMTFNEGHSETGLAWYWKTKKADPEEVENFIRRYESLNDCKVKLLHKLPRNFREKVWYWNK